MLANSCKIQLTHTENEDERDKEIKLSGLHLKCHPDTAWPTTLI